MQEKNEPEYDIIVIGSAGVDTNIYFPENKINFEVEANFTENIDYVGQAGGYTTRGFAQLGHKTAFLGYIGNDHNGELIKKKFREDNIQAYFFVDPAGTKRSVNFMYSDGRRKNFYDGKSHMILQPDLVQCEQILNKIKHAHFNLMNWSRYLLPLCKKIGLTISCDLQDIVDLNDNYRRDFILAADFLFFSNVNFPNPKTVIDEIWKLNQKVVIIVGMGEKGCALAYNRKIQYFQALNLQNHPIIDTNGAGDALVVGFISSYLFDKRDIINSILRGQINARYSCSIKASTDTLITREQLNEYHSCFT